MGSPAIVSLWDRLPPSVQAVNPHLRPKAARTPRLSVMAQHAAAGAPEHAAEIVDSHARRDQARATSRTAQALPRVTHAQRRLERAAWELLAAADAIAEAADA